MFGFYNKILNDSCYNRDFCTINPNEADVHVTKAAADHLLD